MRGKPIFTDIFGECPQCGATWRNGEHAAYSRLIGIEYPEKYDGVWEWRCPDCGVVVPRWEEVK